MEAHLSMRSEWAVILMLLVVATACGGEGDARSEASPDGSVRGSAAEAPSAGAPDTPLCERIEDDEALTPSIAEPLAIPGIREANSTRRCLTAFGVDMAIGELRGFYRSTLEELGYEVTSYREDDGIAQGNLSRTLLRAMKPGLQVNLQIDEFDPSATTLARHTANVKLQIDAAAE